MHNTTTFQLILFIVSGIIIIIAILMFAGIIPGGFSLTGGAQVPTVVLWSSFQEESLIKYFKDLNEANKGLVQFEYEIKPPETYFDDLIEAFARGSGPDIFFADQDMLNRLQGKIAEIPFALYPQRDFINNFVDGAEVFTGSSSIRIMPLLVDPLVLYYDRSAYTSAGIVVAPKTWNDFLKTIPLLTERDDRGNFRRTAAALGEFENIKNAKYIYSALTFQAGNPLTAAGGDGGYKFILRDNLGFQPAPAEAALNFYLQFSNPALETYVWNRSVSEDIDMFTAGQAATYFGFGSELVDLQGKNPHLNIDIMAVPQKDLTKRSTYGRFIGVAIAGNSKNKAGAFLAAGVLAQATNLSSLAEMLSLPPARRDLLFVGQADPLRQALYNSAVFARSWVDPDPGRTRGLLQTMMENVQTSQTPVSAAIDAATGNINLLYLR